MKVDVNTCYSALRDLEVWVERHEYRGYEPFDGLSSYLRPLTFGNLYLERVLQQVVRRSFVNLRPLLGIRPQDSTKGRGYMAGGYLVMNRCTGRDEYAAKAAACLDWLDTNRSPGYPDHSWGNHFDFSSRGGRLPNGEPIIVWTALIGREYLEAYRQWKNPRHLEIAESIGRWILSLPRERTPTGTCLSYVAYTRSSIHNSNLLGAAFLGRLGVILGNEEMLTVAADAVRYSCERQRPDGSWWYGETDHHHWIDNFHTGYNLDSLLDYITFTGDRTFESLLEEGFSYYLNTFFDEDGAPGYYHDSARPYESQNVSQSIETLVKFADRHQDALPRAIDVARWAFQNMRDSSGYFYYRYYSNSLKMKTPMMHWSQATTYHALALLYERMIEEEPGR